MVIEYGRTSFTKVKYLCTSMILGGRNERIN